MDKDTLFAVAKIVDNEYIGSEKTFSSTFSHLKNGWAYILSTNKCDWASNIHVFVEEGEIVKVQRCGADTYGYEDVTETTMIKIKKFLCKTQLLN